MAAAWMRVQVRGPLSPYGEGFGSELTARGYSEGSAAQQVQLLAHLSRWLKGRDLGVGDLTPARVEEFVRARRVAGYTSLLSARALEPLLGYLQRAGLVVAPARAEAITPAERVLDSFRSYLTEERGLLAMTARRYEEVARRFLSERTDGSGELHLWELGTERVTRFVLRQCRGRSPGYGKYQVTALRSLLRYLHLAGWTARSLAGAVPAVAGWRGSSLPRSLEAEQMAALLASCDRRTSIGRRDYAILALLARLGLRAVEVAALELGDLDWSHGEILVRGKGRRQERLPLPVDVGEALVDYLRGSRPGHECAKVFMRARAPYRGLSSAAVKSVVRRACRRAGLPEVGSHRLRHTAATETLRAGAPLSEVGQLLRHRSAATTAMYAKVDRAALRELAQPWPGGAP